MQEEIWKDVEGYEGYYQVSDLGNVKSMSRRIRFLQSITGEEFYRTSKEKVLTGAIDNNGYVLYALRNKGVSSYLGAQWCNTSGKWKSQVRFKGKRHYVGSFDTPLLAHEAYKLKLKELDVS